MKKQDIISEWKNFWVQKNNVERMIQKISWLSKEELFLLDEINISSEEFTSMRENFKKMNFWYPLEYVLELAEFYWLEFFVDKRCLIPRDDTEVMVDKAIDAINESGFKLLYIDVWTWSWAIPVSVVHNTKKLTTAKFMNWCLKESIRSNVYKRR